MSNCKYVMVNIHGNYKDIAQFVSCLAEEEKTKLNKWIWMNKCKKCKNVKCDQPNRSVWLHCKSLSSGQWGVGRRIRTCQGIRCRCPVERGREVTGPRGSQYLPSLASHTLTPLSTLHPETTQLYSQHYDVWQLFFYMVLLLQNIEMHEMYVPTHQKIKPSLK